MIPVMSHPLTGLANELAFITLEETCRHLDNYLGNFVLDDVAGIVYANRFLGAQDLETVPRAVHDLYYCLNRVLEHAPHGVQVLEALNSMSPQPERTELLTFLQRLSPDPHLKEKIVKHIRQDDFDKARRLLHQQLSELPACLWAAAQLLQDDAEHGRHPGSWQTLFKCPAKIRPIWNRMLFHHHAALGFHEDALRLWEQMDEAHSGPYSLNLAAEMYRALGDRGRASALYMQSIKKDPRQQVLRYRLEELANPFTADHSLPGRRSVNIYLYSWNKADFLEKTLRGLAATQTGNARIRLLLNGCTDDSLNRAERIRDEYFKDSMKIISLPVNIGAPAARNWLIALPETREADYTAFLDDDVDVEEHWLAKLLTVLETNPGAGVAGCKVVYPGTPRRLQYLYRTPSVVRDDLFRISFEAPSVRNDTGLYDFIRPTANVMGCCHLFRRQALLDCPTFDICFSPSQMDDIAHDFEMMLKGHGIVYCGLASCVHHQNTGTAFFKTRKLSQHGNIAGNDVKFFYKFWEHRNELRSLMNVRQPSSGGV